MILKNFTTAMTGDESTFMSPSTTFYKTVEFHHGNWKCTPEGDCSFGKAVHNQEQCFHSCTNIKDNYQNTTKANYAEPTNEEMFSMFFGKATDKESTNQNTGSDGNIQNETPLTITGHLQKHAEKYFFFLGLLWVVFVCIARENYYVNFCGICPLYITILDSILYITNVTSGSITDIPEDHPLHISSIGERGKHFINLCSILIVWYCILVGYWTGSSNDSISLLTLLAIGLGALLYAYQSYTDSRVLTLRETLISVWLGLAKIFLIFSILFWVIGFIVQMLI